MHFLVLFAMGGLSGLVSSALQKGSAPRRPQIDVAVGVTGALLGGLLVARCVGGENVPTGNYGFKTLAMSAAVAAIPLAVLSLMRRRLR